LFRQPTSDFYSVVHHPAGKKFAQLEPSNHAAQGSLERIPILEGPMGKLPYFGIGI
jgi:hypothetical protein